MRIKLLLISFLLSVAIKAQSNELYFTPNVGQISTPESFNHSDEPIALCQLQTAVVYLRNNGIRINLTDPNDIPKIHKSFHFKGIDTSFTIKHHVVDILFKNALEPSKIEFLQPAPYYNNYYYGNNPNQWKTNVYPSKTIKLSNVYQNIDFLIYTTTDGGIEFDWIVNPGGNHEDILLNFEGQTGLLLKNKSIVLQTSVGNFSIAAPKAFQTRKLRSKKNKPVKCHYELTDKNEVKLRIPKTDENETLIIDPILVFSTYSGSTADNFGFTATYDTAGCLYAGGIADAESLSYPVTTGAYQTVYGGSLNGAAPVGLPCDITISKYSPDGSKLLFATYLGGSNDEYPHSLSIDPQNNLLVFGTTLSSDFPIHPDSFVSNVYKGNFDIVVTKLNSAGNKMLAGTFLGGTSQDGFQINSGSSKSGLLYNYADNYRGDITTDEEGNVYVATCSHSNDFPITNGAFQNSISGRTDALVFSLTPLLSKIRWSSFFGGSQDDAAYSCRFDDSANLFIGGGTKSNNFPLTANVAVQKTFGGVTDGFILKIQKNSGAYENGTYWGSSAYDQIYFIDLDRDGKVYFTGQTEGFIPRTPGVYGKDSTHQFLGRISNNLSTIEILTTFGNRQNGKPELSPAAFMVDDCYNIYFSGWGSIIGVGNNGSTQGLEITSDAHQKNTDNNDFYLLALKKDAKNLIYASYFGGNQSEDHVDGGTSRFDKRGVIYQSVCSSCPNNPPGLNDFPTTANAVFKNNVSVRCSNASFKLDFRLGYSIDATFYASPTTICLGKTNSFSPRFTYNANYLWKFGDGDSSVVQSPKHLYKKIGKYKITLTIIDTNSCNQKAVYSREISVIETPVPEVKTSKERCVAGITFEASGLKYDSIFWNFGDQSEIIKNTNPILHVYPTGDFTATIIFKNSITGCTDTLIKPISAISDSFENIKLANVFTPNNDAYNNCFKIIGFSLNCDKGEMLIYNRWGEKLFHTYNLTDCWNGRVENSGEPVPSGTYFYIINVTETTNPKSPKTIHGSVNLIRTE
jgi:gliding motility-associated-like protein